MFKTLSRMHKGERGITGLETAIIVIAFVVVAAVFAYTILSSGLFSSQKAEETVHSGVAQSQA
ncbi:MAG: flagellin, partial [Chloroflexi bacterium]|nr:flagellin [Chloroflexota bacterium]